MTTRAQSSRVARDDHARRVMITRLSPPPRQTAISSHESPPHTSFDHSQPLECPFAPWKDRHANRDELRGNRRRTQKPRKFERAKIELFILCPAFLVPNNAKQRRGNCHNPIFTLGFSWALTYKTRRPELSRSDPRGPDRTQEPSKHGQEHISRGSGRFDQV